MLSDLLGFENMMLSDSVVLIYKSLSNISGRPRRKTLHCPGFSNGIEASYCVVFPALTLNMDDTSLYHIQNPFLHAQNRYV